MLLLQKQTYRKVASSNTSHLEAYAGFFRLLMKEIFDKKLISYSVMRVRTRDYTIFITKSLPKPLFLFDGSAAN